MGVQLPDADWTRRRFLALLGMGAAGVLTACSPSPLITAGGERSASATPTLDDKRRAAAVGAATLADLASGCAGIPGADPTFAAWCTALADTHTAHLTVLAQADPLGGVQADHSPIDDVASRGVGVPGSPEEALTVLAAQETALADLLAPIAVGSATSSAWALLWLSQALATRVYAAALAGGSIDALGPAPVEGTAVPAEVDAGTPADARQVLLSHQRALVFGLQTLLGRLGYGDARVDAVTQRLGEAMRERDDTSAAITATGATASAPPPEFTLPGDATDSAQIERIWGELELAVMAGWARLAAADADGRADALDQMVTQAGRARSHGVALPHWPGWV
ncbi:hypothetical protein GCM10009785_32750 [Brooklawnia cerclae]|uniref:DUF4439 domain-containing protein n=1 Tax=Brooklawnia cerclae TaxID=349934 RepID=A0ABX0SK43_9ACTN|nr:DUF4439 domain-containing protein [Brooklawnia cerclae]NIH57420.1 hypothetical protein [Brooklawnia cerclae]